MPGTSGGDKLSRFNEVDVDGARIERPPSEVLNEHRRAESNRPKKGSRKESRARSARRSGRGKPKESRRQYTDQEEASNDDQQTSDTPRPSHGTASKALPKSERHGKYQSTRVDSRKHRMSSWRQIWTINGFLTPWLSGYIMAFFHSAFLRWLGRQTPWMLMILQIGMAGLVGATGLEVIPDEGAWAGARWFAESQGSKLGGWGYCDPAGTCSMRPFYDIRSPDHQEIWYSTMFFSGLILSVGAAGILLLLGGTWTLLFRLLPESASCLTCSGCGSCIESAIDKSVQRSEDKEEEDGDLREPKKIWQVVLEWVMWGFGIWVGIVFVLLEVLQRVLNAQGLVGDTVMTFLFGFAMSWLVVWWVYRSYWALGIREAMMDEDS